MIRKTFTRRFHRTTKRSTRRLRTMFEILEHRCLLAVHTWTGGGTNDFWTNSDNWNGGVPSNGGDVVIPSVSDSEVVRFDAAGVTNLNSLTSDAPFWFAGHDLALSGPGTFRFNNALRMSSGALVGSGTVDVWGHITWSAGAMGGTGITNAHGGMTLNGLNGSPAIQGTRTVNNFAEATLEAAPSTIVPEWFISNNAGAIFNNLPSGSFTIVGTSDFQGGTFNNHGTFIKTAGAIGNGVTHFNVAVFNQISATPVDIQGGTLQLGGGGTHTGDFDFEGATLELGPLATTGPHDFNAGSELTGTTFRVSAGTHNFNAGSSYNVTGSSNFPSGTTTFNGTVLAVGDAVHIGSGFVTFNQNISTGTLTLSRGRLTGSGAVDVSGLLTWSGGEMRGSGITNANGGLVLNNVNGTLGLRDSRTINNPAAATYSGTSGFGSLNLSAAAVFNNLGSGSFTLDGNVDIRNNELVMGTFNNQGTFIKRAGTSDGVTNIRASFSNSGILDIQSGALWLDGPFTNYNSTTKTLSGGTYLVSGVWRFVNANIVTNHATLALHGPASQILDQNTGANGIAGFTSNTATASFTLQNRNLSTTAAGGLFTNAGSMSFDASTFGVAGGQYSQTAGTTTLVNGGLTASNAEIAGGILRGDGTVTGDLQNSGGTVTPGLSTGMITVTGNYSQASGGALGVDIAGRAPAGGGVAGVDFDQLSVGGNVSLAGAVNLAVLGPFVPVAGDVYPVIPNAAALTGTFGAVLGSQINTDGLFFDPEYTPTAFDVIVTHLNAGGDQQVDEGPYGLLASFTDQGADDTYTATIGWGDGSPVEDGAILPGKYVSGSHTYDNGVFVVTVRLLGADGSRATAVFDLTVDNVAPTADAGGPYEVAEGIGGTVQLSGAGSDVAGELDPLTFTWDLDGDGIYGETGQNAKGGDEVGSSPTFSARFLDGPDMIDIYLRVDDGDGGITSDSASIQVTNVAPTAVAPRPFEIPEGGTAELSGEFFDPSIDDSFSLNFQWDLDGDGVFGEGGSNGEHGDENDLHTMFDATSLDGPKTLTITFRVIDDDLAIGEATTTITIANVAPMAEANGPYEVVAGETVQLFSAVSDVAGNNDPLILTWDLDGDNIFGETGPDATGGDEVGNHPTFDAASFDGPSTVEVTLRADDGDGGITIDTATINVLAPESLVEVWTGASVETNLWSDPANWESRRVPRPGAELVFPATAGRLITTNDLPANTMFGSITIEGGSYDMGGNRLLLGEGGLVVNGGSHTLSASYAWIISPFCRLRAEAGSVVTMAGVLGGEGLQKQGEGTLILTAANTISGEILVEEGELVLRHSMALGSPAGQTKLRGGTSLVLQNNITVEDDLVLEGDPPGTVFPGVTVFSHGNNSIGDEATPAEAPRIALNPFLTVTVVDGTLTINGVMSGEDDLAKDGPGTLILNADNTLTGVITLLDGTLLVNGSQPNTPIVVEGGTLGGSGLLGPITLSGGQIEGAVVQASPIEAGRTDLVVGGTVADDRILFSPGHTRGTVEAFINNVSQGTFSPTGRLIAYGMAGNDDIEAAGSLPHSAWFYGGIGNDRLKGGAGHNVLFGGDGDDLLIGGSRRDLMIGGTGGDRLVGASDDDILIAGATAFDAHVQALGAIMAEWTSTRDYTTRVGNLRGEGSGPRLNGEIFLKAGGPDATVFDDNDRDMLTGASGSDWFFANLDRRSDDKITDLHRSELAVALEV
ncbi:MAG: autotransporter-associated beta strand repeat-containing protein [Pirellulales bacterium]